MKRATFLVILFALFTCNIASATVTSIDWTKTTPPPIPRIQSMMLMELPVSGTISETELAIYFESSVGDATITVYDANNSIVYQETVDTDSESSVVVSSSNWSAGSYSISISYGTTSLIGYFDME